MLGVMLFDIVVAAETVGCGGSRDCEIMVVAAGTVGLSALSRFTSDTECGELGTFEGRDLWEVEWIRNLEMKTGL